MIINHHRQLKRKTRAAVAGILAAGLAGVFAPGTFAGHAEHVVVVVFDGLRPDSVTEEDTPTLYKLGHEGTTFANHHPVYPSSTEVNGSALATGGSPQHDGIMANKEYRPDIELLKPIEMEELKAVRKGDQMTNGRYLAMPTVAEMLRRAGRKTVVAGTKPVALLLDRSERSADATGVDVAAGNALPREAFIGGSPATQPYPKVADATKKANRGQDAWTTHVLVDRLWKNEVPAFTMLWLSEPDYAQHGSGPGSAVARDALHSSDENLATVLDALDAAHLRDKTDVLVVSDHGFSTISRTVDVVKVLKAAGFDAFVAFKTKPEKGQILVVPLGGTTLLYVVEHDAEVMGRLVKFLQISDFAGPLFTQPTAEGTFPLSAAGIETSGSPDVVVAMRWTDEKSKTGLPGMIVGTAVKYGPGQGYHASLSRYDMHNTLIACGPDFRSGYIDELPSGNSDVAPTVMWLLGVKPEVAMDGRVLSEAMIGGWPSQSAPETTKIEASREVDGKTWRQYLKITKLGKATYYDAGNATTEAR
jgi:arylsulfatase A-like enzyme